MIVGHLPGRKPPSSSSWGTDRNDKLQLTPRLGSLQIAKGPSSMTFKFPVGPVRGVCNLCGVDADLTVNHVPPKAWAKGLALRVSSIADNISGEKRPASHKMPDGVCFRSLCKECNGAIMAPYDRALISMTDQICEILRDPLKVTYYQPIRVRPQQIARGILGHICSVGLGRHDERLSRHIFEPASDLLSEVRLSYWVYPYSGRTVIRDFALGNLGTGKSAAMYILKSYPVAFAMAWNKDFLFDQWQPQNFDQYAGIGPADEVDLPIEFIGLPGQVWPEHVQGNHFAAMHDDGAFSAREKDARRALLK